MVDIKDNSFKYLTFSQLYGYEPLPEPMRLEVLSKELRQDLCYVVYKILNVREPAFRQMNNLWHVRVLGRFLKKPKDEMVKSCDGIYELFKHHLLEDPFNRVLDLTQLIVNNTDANRIFARSRAPAEEVQQLFEQHLAAYYLDLSQQPFLFHPRCSKEQGDATIKAINTIQENGMNASASHLQQAAIHINAQQYGDSIADSIHAVESVARSIDHKAAHTLTSALNNLEKHGLKLHPALKEGLKKLYGYTSDEQGVRHALIDKDSPEVGLDEAMFMFGACASFVAYLVNKHQKLNSES